MSECISHHGEYSSHTSGDDYICTMCGAVDLDALIGELRKLRTERNTWARQLADAHDERDTARAEAEQAKINLAESTNAHTALLVRIDELEEELVGVRSTVDRAREMHDRVHLCADHNWYNPHHSARAKSAKPDPCPTVRALDGGA